LNSKKIGKIQKEIVKRYEKYIRKLWNDMENTEENSEIFRKYGRKISWIVVIYGNYGRKISWIVVIYGNYGKKLWNNMEKIRKIVKWYGKYGRK
jgi:hypothetical protein